MADTVRIERVAARGIAVVRRTGTIAQLPFMLPEACGVVWNTLKGAGVKGAGRNVALYLDAVMHLEVGVEMDGDFKGIGEVVRSELPGGEVAAVTHYGAYGGLGKVHEGIREFCAREERAITGVCWELYGHWETAWEKEPGKIRTDVFYLLK